MPDMLVKLYDIPEMKPQVQKMASLGIAIRRVLASEKHLVLDWIEKEFNKAWRSEADVAISYLPVACFIAVEEKTKKILGFACYDTACRNFFGPFGVAEDQRGKGIGTALLIACLHAMRQQGFGYAIIGAAGPVEYYKKTVSAVVIEDSVPGIYKGKLSDLPT